MMRRAGLLLVIVLGLLAAMASLRGLSDPPALRTTNAPGEFDAVRAKARLARLLGDQRPHPSDSPANDAVQARLLAELRAIGLQPRVDSRFACNGKPGGGPGIECGRVRNVLASIGPDSGKHLLIVSHYDSVPVGPGAGDDGIGVASMIEVASLLKDRPLARPVTFLFNEGEELGLVGARAFLDGDPLRDKVDAVLNVEARGVRGPVAMFETNDPNATAVRLYSAVVRSPTSNSLAVSAYRLLPNSTDVTTFAEKGWLALNFAPTGNETRYHSAGDDLAALDPATLQHMGDQLLDTAGALAAAPTPRRIAGELLFMNLGQHMLTLPLWLGWLCLAGLIMIFAIAAVRRRALASGVPALAGAMLGGTALAWLGLTLVGGLRHGTFWRAHQVVSEVAVYAGVIAAALIMLAIVRRLTARQWRVAFWLMFTLLGALIGTRASGGLVYFLLPPAVAALGIVAARWWRPAETTAAIVAAALLFVTMGAMLGLLGELFNSGPLWILAIVGALVLLPWLVELRPLTAHLRPRPLALAAIALPIVAWTGAATRPAYSSDRQQQFTIEHVTDRGDNKTYWGIVNDRAPLPAAIDPGATWRFASVPYATRSRWQSPAPALADAPDASLRMVAQRVEGSRRRVRVQIVAGGANAVTVVLPASARLLAAGPDGRLRTIVTKSGGKATLSCGGRGCDGALIDLVFAQAKPVEALVVGRRYGLPDAARELEASRPADARPQYVPDSMVGLRKVML